MNLNHPDYISENVYTSLNFRRKRFGTNPLGVSLASRHLGELESHASLRHTAGSKGPCFRGGGERKGKKKFGCNRCSKNRRSFLRDEVGGGNRLSDS